MALFLFLRFHFLLFPPPLSLCLLPDMPPRCYGITPSLYLCRGRIASEENYIQMRRKSIPRWDIGWAVRLVGRAEESVEESRTCTGIARGHVEYNILFVIRILLWIRALTFLLVLYSCLTMRTITHCFLSFSLYHFSLPCFSCLLPFHSPLCFIFDVFLSFH